MARKPYTTADEALIDVLAHLVAAVSLLSQGGLKAAPSNKMGRQMLKDYEDSIKRGRAYIKKSRASASDA